MNPSQRIASIIQILIGGLILVFPAFYNRYPLMYFDSGAYMEMAVNLEPSFHRALGYPILMKFTGFLISNWPIVIIQGVVASALLYRLVQLLFEPKRHAWYHFLTVIVLAFGSSLSWYASQLMPDVFTFILILTAGLVFIEKDWTKLKYGLYGLLLYLSLMTHLSHFPIYGLILITIAALYFASKRQSFAFNRSIWGLLVIPMLTAFLTLSSFNAAYNYGFRLSLSSNAFITASIGEMGLLKMYLDENCPEAPEVLCNIKDDLPRETYGYLWDPEGAVQNHPRGWEGANEEFGQVVQDFIGKPRYLKWLVFGSVKATVKQLFQIELGSGLQYAYGEGTPPYWPMKSHFKQELNEYLISVQNKGDQLPISFFRWLNYITLIASLLILGWAITHRALTPELGMLLLLFGLAYFFNAAVTGVLANVYERLQCRLLPLLQLLGLLLYLKVYHLRDEQNTT